MKIVDDLEEELLARLGSEDGGRTITKLEGTHWGRLILPSQKEAARRPVQGLKVLAFGSWTLGLLSLEALLSMEGELPRDIRLVGLVTDDPLDADARISVKKRFWRYYSQAEREEYEWALLHRALPLGIPCYTGEVKCDAFRSLLARWDPDAIVVAAFGQLIDSAIISFPKYGIYNVHPSDLLHGQGAGPQPWEDLVRRKAPSTRVTLHWVSPEIDGGDIVGQSPEINVLMPDGSFSDDVRMVGEKTLVPVRAMVQELLLALMEKKASGDEGPLDALDFEQIFSHDFKKRLREPLDPLNRGRTLPLPEGEMRYTV